jgi:hypothetical protein
MEETGVSINPWTSSASATDGRALRVRFDCSDFRLSPSLNLVRFIIGSGRLDPMHASALWLCLHLVSLTYAQRMRPGRDVAAPMLTVTAAAVMRQLFCQRLTQARCNAETMAARSSM